MKNKTIIIIAIAVCIVGLIGWYCYEEYLWEVVPNNKHISKIKTDGIRVRVTIPNESSLFELVDMSVFNGFETGYSFKDAVSVYGRPDNVTESKGRSALEYWKEGGRIQVVREEISSGNHWSLVAYPSSVNYRDLLTEEIAKRVNPKNDESIIVIDSDKGDLLMVIVISGYRTDHLNWAYLRFKSPKS